MRIAFGCDHGGFALKPVVLDFFKQRGCQVEDLGTMRDDVASDYPDAAGRVARRVASGKANLGVLCCGSGIGMSIAANKVKGVRAAVLWGSESAALAREHNHVNVICFGARLLTAKQVGVILRAFWRAKPSQEPRHARRIRKLAALEGGRR
ncbi:MAG: RpiB/LacA/LacB family sugar-phosphate isomerase [Elusimicrobiota bacterium]